jgi:hypothetical protein
MMGIETALQVLADALGRPLYNKAVVGNLGKKLLL